MKYLKVFETDTDQQNYINGEFDRPNITIVRHKKQSINYVPNIIDEEDKIVNKITFKNLYTIGPEVYAERYCDFAPTSIVDIVFYSVSGYVTGHGSVSPSYHADGAGIVLGLTLDAPFTVDWTPKEDNTYIYEVVIEQESLITFTVDGTEYQAEEGITWRDWCDSEYNTAGFIHAAADQGFAIYTADRKKAFNHGMTYDSLVISGNYLLSKVDWPIPK